MKLNNEQLGLITAYVENQDLSKIQKATAEKLWDKIGEKKQDLIIRFLDGLNTEQLTTSKE